MSDKPKRLDPEREKLYRAYLVTPEMMEVWAEIDAVREEKRELRSVADNLLDKLYRQLTQK